MLSAQELEKIMDAGKELILLIGTFSHLIRSLELGGCKRMCCHFDIRRVYPCFSIAHNPLASSAGVKAAAGCNVGVAHICGFVRYGFDLPFPPEVLYARAGIAAFGIKHAAVQTLLLCRIENSVDGDSICASGAADDHGDRLRVV